MPRVLSKHTCPDSEPPNEEGSDPTVLVYTQVLKNSHSIWAHTLAMPRASVAFE